MKESQMKSERLPRRRILGALAVTLLVGWGAASADAQVMDRILSEKKIKIGYIPSPPGTIKDSKSGEVSGFYIDSIRLVFKMVNVEPILIETTWANFVAGAPSAAVAPHPSRHLASAPRRGGRA